MAHAGGRPTKYRKKHCKTVLEMMKKGNSIVQIASALEVSRDTIYEWVKVHKEFSDTVGIGLAHAEAYWEMILQAGAMGANTEPVNQGLLSLIMKCRYQWREPKEVQLTADVTTTTMTPDNRKKRIAEFMGMINES